MTAGTYSPRRPLGKGIALIFISAALLLSVSFFGELNLFAATTESVLKVPQIGSPLWSPETLENSLGELSQSVYLATSYQAVDPTQFGLPEPPNDVCKVIESLSGKPCIWSIEVGTLETGEQVFDAELKSGDIEIVKAQGMRLNLAKVESGLPTSFAGSQHGWLSYIETPKWLRGLGFGKLGLKAFDAIAKTISAGIGGEKAVHIFADVSEIKWGAAMVESQKIFQKISEDLWIYLIQ